MIRSEDQARMNWYSQQTDGNVRGGVDETHNPLVPIACRLVGASRRIVGDTELDIEREVGAI